MYTYVFVSIDAEPTIYMVKAYDDTHAIGKLREYLEHTYGAILRDAEWLVTFDFPGGNVEAYTMYKVTDGELKGVKKL